MITEKGTIKVETALNADMQREFTHKMYVIGVVSLVLGCVGLAVYFVWDISTLFFKFLEPSVVMLIVFAVLFGLGLIFVITCRNVVKQTSRGPVKVEVYEFYNNYMIAEDYFNGEKVATVKFYYSQIIKRRETANYLFIYIQANAALPVSKFGLSDGELNILRRLFGLPVKGETTVVLATGQDVNAAPAPTYIAGNTMYTHQQPPQDPFADFAQPTQPAQPMQNVQTVQTDESGEAQPTQDMQPELEKSESVQTAEPVENEENKDE